MITREETQKLVFVEAHGHSAEEHLGIPKLVLRTPDKESREDLLEFDFVVVPSEESKRKSLSWELKVVFDVDQLPLQPNWIKVNAGQNADIVRVNEY